PANSRDFRIKAPRDIASATVDLLSDELKKMNRSFSHLSVLTEFTHERHPQGMEPLLTIAECLEVGCFLVGLEIPPSYKNITSNEFYYLYSQRLRKNLSKILRITIYSFLRIQTSSDIKSYHALGSQKL